MKIDLSGRTALVTGGSRGLGFSIAKSFAEAGASVVLLARRESLLADAQKEIGSAAGRTVSGYACDVTDRKRVGEIFAALAAAGQQVDIVVNNAGGSVRKPFQEIDDELWQRDLDTKVFSAANIIRHVLPGMKERQWGRIINIVSTAPKTPGIKVAPTVVSRAAGITMTKTLSSEVARFNVLVNAICIGCVMSDQWIGFHKEEAPELTFEQYLAKRSETIPMGRLGRGEEVGAVASFLASDLASYVTGVALNVDGGWCPVP